MKYEYLNGSEKDFEGAPEWATECIWNDKGSESFCYWLNPETKTILNPNWHKNPGYWDGTYGWRNYIKAERRPITEPELKPVYGDGIHDDTEALQQRIDMGIDINSVIGEQRKLFKISKPLQFGVGTDSVVNQQLTTEWNGEGLPPVGVECELFDSEDGWQKCFIKFIGTNTAVVGTDVAEYSFELSTCEFRPIRSPEDVARDVAALDLFLTINFNDTEADWVAMGARRNDYYKAIDAGYRKTPTVSELMRVTEKATREDCEAIVKLLGGKP